MKTPLHSAQILLGRIPRRARAGFTLIELLVVMVIMAILATTIPALQSVLQGTMITQGGQSLVEEINQARQIASSRNITVQVRLIQLAQVQNSSATGYNAIQLWGTPSGSSQVIALNRMAILPTAVVISQDSTNYSPLLSILPTTTLSTMTVPAGTANYIYFSIMPSGMIPVSTTNMATAEATEMKLAYLSIVSSHSGSATSGVTNYVIVQMNPNTGSTLAYRP